MDGRNAGGCVIAQPQVQFELPIGTMLGKYEILRKLAMGGMAEIYLARVRGTAGFEKIVVVKRILPTVADDPKFVSMFLEEARLAAALQHPNIGDVYEVDEHAGTPFFAMEFIHGKDVRELKRAARERNERVPFSIALAIINATASALDYAHDRVGPSGTRLSLVHRDVSPSNILVSYDGAIKLIDFGIARAASHGQQTQVGTLKGKIPYMSPEQCRGQSLDQRSDLFSLGVVMYELTVGRRPFRGDNDFGILDAIVHQQAPRPIEVARGYPAALDAIVMKLLAREPDDRYQSAEDFLHALEQFIAEHRLWVSPKALSRYMRTVFAESFAAWDPAFDERVTVADVPASPISRSRSPTAATPPSAFPGIARLSQEMPSVHSTGDSARGSAPIELRKRNRSTGVVITLVAAAVVGGGLYWMQYLAPTQTAETTPAQTIQLPTNEPVQIKPDEKQPAEALPPTPPPAADHAADNEADNEAAEAAASEPPTKTVAKDIPKRPKPAKPVKPTKPVKAKDAPVPESPKEQPVKQPPPKQDPPKDPQWNNDSPFLP